MVRTERGTEKEGDELHCWKGSGVWCVVCVCVCVCSWVAKRSDDEIVQLLSNRFFRPGVTIFKFQMSATCRAKEKQASPPPIENTTPFFSAAFSPPMCVASVDSPVVVLFPCLGYKLVRPP